jgi:hypothetical protein
LPFEDENNQNNFTILTDPHPTNNHGERSAAKCRAGFRVVESLVAMGEKCRNRSSIFLTSQNGHQDLLR